MSLWDTLAGAGGGSDRLRPLLEQMTDTVTTSTETDEFGEERHRSQEFVVLDRVGRLQLPQEYVRTLGLDGLVRLELADDHAQVHPTEPAKGAGE